MSDVRVAVNGENLHLDVSGALWWGAERTLVFADLHFEKGSSFARKGTLLPPYDTRATLARIAERIARYTPTRVVALGDSFHDPEAPERLDAGERRLLEGLSRDLDWIWIAGNHDPALPSWLGGRTAEEICIGGLTFRHEPRSTPAAGEIAGHLHPCATVTRRGRSLRRRCFVSDGVRLLMPAFGAYTGGLDVRDAAISALFSAHALTYLLGKQRVYAIAA